MLRKISLPAAMAMTLCGTLMAAPPVQSPREVNQDRGLQSSERMLQERARGQRTFQTGQPQQVPARTDGAIRETTPHTTNYQNTDSTQPGQLQSLDQHVADCLLIRNQAEINLARFAREKTQSDAVRQLIDHLIRDHEAWGQRLNQFAGHQQNSTVPASEGVSQTQLPVQTPAERREARQELRNQGQSNREAREIVRDARQAGAAALNEAADAVSGNRVEHQVGYGNRSATHDQMYQIAQDAAVRCEQMTKDLLNKEQEAHFDQAFLGCQLGGHISLLAELQAVEPHVSAELQQVVRDGSKTVQQHYDAIYDLMKQDLQRKGQ